MAEEREVQLYVYDLSQGLARQFSLMFLGIQIDAVYHTSIVIGGAEYYYGQGIQYAIPGQTHHGAPLEILPLGTTSLPDDVILEYLESLRTIYSPEAYDLFMHNCNNFSNDVSQFLCGRKIPEHITSLPHTVLNTPFGQMLKPRLEAALRPITTAPTPTSAHVAVGRVKIAGSLSELDKLLDDARERCAVVFFTSASCPPCKTVYPHFEKLAGEFSPKVTFVKVDVGHAIDAGQKYGITATPTFITFLNGSKADEWRGAGVAELRTNVEMLIRMAYPPHPHAKIDLPLTLKPENFRPSIYTKIPPLEKVIAKLGETGQHPIVHEIRDFIAKKNLKGSIETRLPDLSSWSAFLQKSLETMDPETLFPLIDLFRVLFTDTRVAGWFAEEKGHATVEAIFLLVTTKKVPYSLRLVTLQATCNLFTTPLFPAHIVAPPLSTHVLPFISSSLLDKTNANTRIAASALVFNIAIYIQKQRSEERREVMNESESAELLAAIVETLKEEKDNKDVGKGLVTALGLMMYCAPLGEAVEMVKVLEAGRVVREAGKRLEVEELAKEVAGLFEAKI